MKAGQCLTDIGNRNCIISIECRFEDLPGKELPNPHVNKEQLDTLAGMVKVKFGDINTIIEFLNTLNDEKYDRQVPASVPSGLPVGGNIH